MPGASEEARAMRVVVCCLLIPVLGLALSAGCNGCGEPVGPEEGEGEGVVVGEGEGEAAGGEGEGEAVGEGEGEGEAVGEGEGEVVDGGNGFDLENLLDGGVLDCLPTALPELSVTGALDALALSPYSGRTEDGVRCDDVICNEGVSCCVVCGFGACAAPPDGAPDGGPAECPAFTQEYACDGDEECPGRDVCCFTLQGTECRPEADCDFNASDTLSEFFVDGGFRVPDAGPAVDGGFIDGGFVPVTAIDGGFTDAGFTDGGFAGDDPANGAALDGGALQNEPIDGGFAGGGAIDGGPGPQPDGGSVLDSLQETLDQGVPVCRSSFFDCDLLSAELCCTSDRLTSVDVGFCLPALLCAGSFLP